jgi:hypothetical protein
MQLVYVYICAVSLSVMEVTVSLESWWQCYKNLFSLSLTMYRNKLVCSLLSNLLRLFVIKVSKHHKVLHSR